MKIVAVIISLFSIVTVFADGGDRGGGDVVYCKKSIKNGLSGYYSWDYVVTLKSKTYTPYQFRKRNSCKQNLLLIQNKLMRVDKSLGKSFKSYLDNMRKRNDWSSDRVWLPCQGKRCLVKLYDTNEGSKIPSNCNSKIPKGIYPLTSFDAAGYQENQRANVFQIISRKRKGMKIEYAVNDTLMKEVEKRPLQCSFLHVHEWLRDLKRGDSVGKWYTNSREIYKLTKYLHAKEFIKEKSKDKIFYNLAKLHAFDEREHLAKYFPKLYKKIFSKSSKLPKRKKYLIIVNRNNCRGAVEELGNLSRRYGMRNASCELAKTRLKKAEFELRRLSKKRKLNTEESDKKKDILGSMKGQKEIVRSCKNPKIIKNDKKLKTYAHAMIKENCGRCME